MYQMLNRSTKLHCRCAQIFHSKIFMLSKSCWTIRNLRYELLVREKRKELYIWTQWNILSSAWVRIAVCILENRSIKFFRLIISMAPLNTEACPISSPSVPNFGPAMSEVSWLVILLISRLIHPVSSVVRAPSQGNLIGVWSIVTRAWPRKAVQLSLPLFPLCVEISEGIGQM